MSGERFPASWLALREPMDHRSRPGSLLAPLGEAWAAGGWSRVADLGSGTGSNLRYLAPRLPGSQRWTLVDHDAALLAEAEHRAPDHPGAPGTGRAGEVAVETRVGDLAEAGLEAARGAHLVTASALLDLVPEAWLRRLVDACRSAGAGALLALSYDGTVTWSGPPHPDDEVVRDAVNRHQRTDKGLGPALGPEAAPVARELFRDAGFRTILEPSPWVVTSDDGALAEALIRGWRDAAIELHPGETERLQAWARQRRASLASATLTVGHLDLLALP